MIVKPQDINIHMGERGLQFTTQETYFLFALVCGKQPYAAARDAGYTEPRVNAGMLLSRVDINDAFEHLLSLKESQLVPDEFTLEDATAMYFDAYAASATATEMKNTVDSMVKLHGLAKPDRKEIILTNATQVRGATEQELINQIGNMGGREIRLDPSQYTVKANEK